MPGVGEDRPPELQAMFFDMSGSPYSLEKMLSKQKPMQLPALSSHKILQLEGEKFSVKELVEYFANRAGGAHYSKTLPEHFWKILNLLPVGQFPMREALVNHLRQIGEVTYDVGLRAIRGLAEVRVCVDLQVITLNAPSCLFELSYPNSVARLALGIDADEHLAGTVIAFDGRALEVTLQEKVDWSARHVVCIDVAFDENFDMHMRVAVEDLKLETSSHTVRPFCLPFLYGTDFDFAINRHVDETSSSSSIALARLAIYQLDDMTNRAGIDEFLADLTVEHSAARYDKGSSSFSAAGERDQKMDGNVVKITLAGVSRGSM